MMKLYRYVGNNKYLDLNFLKGLVIAAFMFMESRFHRALVSIVLI